MKTKHFSLPKAQGKERESLQCLKTEAEEINLVSTNTKPEINSVTTRCC